MYSKWTISRGLRQFEYCFPDNIRIKTKLSIDETDTDGNCLMVAHISIDKLFVYVIQLFFFGWDCNLTQLTTSILRHHDNFATSLVFNFLTGRVASKNLFGQ